VAGGNAVYLDFRDSIDRLGKDTIEARYGNLFDMYQRITDENPYQVPMRIFPAPHYTMGGLWVDYNLMSNIEGLHVLGEANFSDHGANRLGASALMQGLADGYFVIPYTMGHYLASNTLDAVETSHPAFKDAEGAVKDRLERVLAIGGSTPSDDIHRRLGRIMWDHCGMARTQESLSKALELIPQLRDEFWQDVKVLGGMNEFNQSLEKANRVADFLEFAEMMCYDALTRDESCGGHFRLEHQSEDGEAVRNDQDFKHVAAWEYRGAGEKPELHKEELEFENVQLATRSYK
jgi:succinate dehydrogenase / fumarate reductase flavoprotein subunit